MKSTLFQSVLSLYVALLWSSSVSAQEPIPTSGTVVTGEVPESTIVQPTHIEIPMVPAISILDENIVKSYYVELPYNKTISIIFPNSIRSVDLGSRDIIADKATDVDNVLKLKSTRNGFAETNFSVITADGKFWSFVANFNEFPQILALNLAAGTSESLLKKAALTTYFNGEDTKDGVVQFTGVNASQSEVVYNCSEILKKRRTVRHLGVEANKMEASIRGVYVKDNVVYYKLAIKNKSNVNYDIDFIRFFIVDQTHAKRTSLQELEVSPLFVYNKEVNTIRGHQTIERIFAFQKFTIPDDKRVRIVTGEIGGGRALIWNMNNSDIMNADNL